MSAVCHLAHHILILPTQLRCCHLRCKSSSFCSQANPRIVCKPSATSVPQHCSLFCPHHTSATFLTRNQLQSILFFVWALICPRSTPVCPAATSTGCMVCHGALKSATPPSRLCTPNWVRQVDMLSNTHAAATPSLILSCSHSFTLTLTHSQGSRGSGTSKPGLHRSVPVGSGGVTEGQRHAHACMLGVAVPPVHKPGRGPVLAVLAVFYAHTHAHTHSTHSTHHMQGAAATMCCGDPVPSPTLLTPLTSPAHVGPLLPHCLAPSSHPCPGHAC